MAATESGQAGAETPRFESVEAAFVALESPLLGYALRLLRDRALAEDTVQEAFLKLQAQFNHVSEPRRWLYRTVHNLALNHQRHAGRLVPLDPPGAPPSSVHGERVGVRGDSPNEASLVNATDPQLLPDEQIARAEALGLVRLALKALDARSRELVRLKFEEDFSYKEMSARTGLTVGHVGYLLHHALKTIAAELAKAGVVP